MRYRTGLVLCVALAAATAVVVQPLRDRPDAASPSASAEVDRAYRFERRPAARPRAVQGVDPAHDRHLLTCDPGTPAGWTRVLSPPGTTTGRLGRPRIGDLRRSDGVSQVTVDGCPIYRRGAGPLHDAAGTWFVVMP
jgi:hypothetical protein